MIILLHGFGSNGVDSNTNKAIAAQFPDELVLTPTYPYRDATQTAFYLKGFVDGMLVDHPDEADLIFIGSSLGAFWARYLANEFQGSKLIMLNPSLEAHINTVKYVGISRDFCTGQDVIMNIDHCEDFRNYYVHTDRLDIPITIIVADDDDVVPPTAADILIGASRANIIHTTGGHRLDGTLETHLSDIEKAVYILAM